MFEDKRSRKVLLVAHCILNQNSKIDRCAHYPGAVSELIKLIMEAGVGILQMPCPELLYLGLDRQVDRDVQVTVESEDTRVALRMGEAGGKALCQRLASELVNQIIEYRKNGFTVLGLAGINGSPTCGIETSWDAGHENQDFGVFTGLLNEECQREGIVLPMRGLKVYEPGKALAAVRELLSAGNQG